MAAALIWQPVAGGWGHGFTITASLRTSACNVCSNVHSNFWQNFSTGNPDTSFFLLLISMTTRARDFKFAGAVVKSCIAGIGCSW